MKKEGFVLISIVLLVLSSFLVIAQDAKVDKAYDCLRDKVKDNCDSLNVEERAFAGMAIGQCISELADDSNNNQCWPSSSCRLRDTSLVILAFRRNSKNTDDAEEWLTQQTETPDDLIWFLEIDADQESACTVSYNGRDYDITLKDDKKISGSGGSCLSVDSSGYWLEIDEACYDNNFTISCDKEFLTTLLYKKKTGSTVYVSSKTNFAPSEGKTEEKINSLCFGVNCDYEGSLWATIALAETGHDVSPYLPYLIAMAEENERYFPSAFLYIITDYDDFFADIIDLQVNDYWRITDSPYHQFYDTALALLALQGLDSQQASAAKSYLLEVQEDNGCWRDSVRDTAFILYAAWPKGVSPGPGPSTDYCEDFDFYCVASTECDEDDIKDLPCEGSAGKVCCKEPPKQETCADKGGEKCEGDEECDGGRYVEASDTSRCCRGSCIIPEPPEPECELEGYFCRTECYDDEQENIFDCNSGEFCCEPKPPSPSYWWIWLLVILIILVVLGIIFRDKIRAFIFKMRRGSRKTPPPGPPGRRFPPSKLPMRPRMIPRQTRQPVIPARPPARPLSRQPPTKVPVKPSPKPVQPQPSPKAPLKAPPKTPPRKKDKEMEDTLKKLKEMSK